VIYITIIWTIMYDGVWKRTHVSYHVCITLDVSAPQSDSL